MNCKHEDFLVAAYFHSLGYIAKRTGLYQEDPVELAVTLVSKFTDILPDTVCSDNVRMIISNYNSTENVEFRLLKIASNLACGYDESKILNIEDKPGSAMKHLLSSLKLCENEKTKTAYYNADVLKGNAVLASNKDNISKNEYLELWNLFEKDLAKFPKLSISHFIQSFDTLLEHYFWSIPLINEDEVDIGFYQHTKNTVAIVSVLYKVEEDKQNSATDFKKENFLFINGDISGIQKYIFELKENEYSSKLLRARSFQLWALSEILSQYIVKKFDLCIANIIVSAGGKFIVMLPNIGSASAKITELQIEIEKFFLNEFSGKLAVIISDGVPASADMLLKQNAQDLFNRIGTMADVCKQHKMQKALNLMGHKLERNYELLQKNGECPKCGIFPASTTDGNQECPNCKVLVEIGKNLIHGNYITLNSDKLSTFGDMIQISKKSEGFSYTINEYIPGYPVLNLPYIAPYKNDYELKTFEDLANQSNGKIAMFKSDIDNLGLVFSSALGSNISLSTYASLSHLLHYFFSAFYVNFIKTQNDHNGKPYADSIYTVFSGGDDLCVLGSWDSIMQFACDFQKQITLFTNNNPSVTLSGAIALSASKNPVANIARNAEELLELSKDYPKHRPETEGPLKNAISVFNTSVSWADYEKMLELGKEIEIELRNKNVSTGVIYKFIDFSNRAERSLDGNLNDLISQRTWKSNLIYTVIRNVKKNKELAEKLKSLGVDANEMVKARIAICYALYKQR